MRGIRYYLVADGVLVLVFFILAVVLKKNHPDGPSWPLLAFVLLGVLACGIMIGGFLSELQARQGRWEPEVTTAYSGGVRVILRRRDQIVTIVQELDAGKDDFDEQLHEALAAARQRATALNVASGTPTHRKDRT